MANQDAPRADAQGAGRGHVVAFLEGQDLGPGEAGVADPAGDGQGDNQIIDARPQDPRQGNGQENAGKGEEDIDQSHQHQIHPAPGKGADAAHQDPDQGREGDDAKPHQEGDAGPHQEPVQDGAAQVITAEQRPGARSHQNRRQVHRVRRQGQPGSDQGHDHPEHQKHRRRNPAHPGRPAARQGRHHDRQWMRGSTQV
jgi:hypothetical protein